MEQDKNPYSLVTSEAGIGIRLITPKPDIAVPPKKITHDQNQVAFTDDLRYGENNLDLQFKNEEVLDINHLNDDEGYDNPHELLDDK